MEKDSLFDIVAQCKKQPPVSIVVFCGPCFILRVSIIGSRGGFAAINIGPGLA